MNKYTLRQLNLLVRAAIETSLDDEYWVEAELSECREHGGHCYMELVEKADGSNTPVARASAKCWRQTWQVVAPRFLQTTGMPLRAGMKVLLRVYAQFHEAYGFSWIVSDIDPTYTLGDMARRRQEIIRQLKAEGVFDLQRELRLPLFCQRIAVISAPNAAGYGDFCRQLEENAYGLKFSVTLFPAVMQGEQVEATVIEALNRIYEAMETEGDSSLAGNGGKLFDAVVIIRGGGGTADLSGFDTKALAENVAQFPLPVITGIGHDRDESILDMVSNTRVKTPTAAATLLIDRLKAVLDHICQLEDVLDHVTGIRLQTEQQRIERLQTIIPTIALRLIANGRHRLDMTEQRMPMAVERRLTAQRHLLAQTELKLQGFDPQLLLSRGYSITLHEGRAVRDASLLKPGDLLETRLEKGTVRSVVTA